MFPKPDFYGSASVGERGQIVLPAKLRKAFGINAGDQLLVMADPHMNSVMLVKAEVLSAMMSNANEMISDMNKDISKALKTKKKKGD